MMLEEHSWEDGWASLLMRVSLHSSFIRLWHLHLSNYRRSCYSGRKWPRFTLDVKFYMLYLTQDGFNGTKCVFWWAVWVHQLIWSSTKLHLLHPDRSPYCSALWCGWTLHLWSLLSFIIFIYGTWAKTIHHLLLFIPTNSSSTRTIFNLQRTDCFLCLFKLKRKRKLN